MSNAWAGGGEDFNMRQIQNVAQNMVQSVTKHVEPEHHDPLEKTLLLISESVPGGIWTVLGCAGFGALMLFAMVFRHKVAPVLRTMARVLEPKPK